MADNDLRFQLERLELRVGELEDALKAHVGWDEHELSVELKVNGETLPLRPAES